MSGPPPPGQQPTPQQMAAMQQQMALEAQKRGMTPQQFQQMQRLQLEADAKKAGLTFEQYINKLKTQAFETHQKQQQMAQQQAAAGGAQQSGQPQQGQQVPINPGAPDPKGIAVAKWLRNQDLKTRTCILNGQRKDMFRGKLHHATPKDIISCPQSCRLRSEKRSSSPFLISQTRSSRPPVPLLCQSLLCEELSPSPREFLRHSFRSI